eukprot:TRINITY_DN6938_c0_g1_i3.p1 TRINITY_DN6938_c0_g1~~TRINITY_DN6938_c0_g1_i3.p1  ORF type:complete len:826 (-),score=263.81 TRINITY_DN6938_c0_g1_i3:836-3313(-)
MKHKAQLNQQAVPEWKAHYIDYGALEKELQKVAKKVHAQVHKLRPVEPPDFRSEPERSSQRIVLKDVPGYSELVDRLANEVCKAKEFYAVKLMEAKIEFLHLVRVCIQLGLISRYQISDPSEMEIDPGSTIALMLREDHLHNGMILAEQEAEEPYTYENPIAGLMFRASTSHDSKTRGDEDVRVGMIESWLSGRETAAPAAADTHPTNQGPTPLGAVAESPALHAISSHNLQEMKESERLTSLCLDQAAGSGSVMHRLLSKNMHRHQSKRQGSEPGSSAKSPASGASGAGNEDISEQDIVNFKKQSQDDVWSRIKVKVLDLPDKKREMLVKAVQDDMLEYYLQIMLLESFGDVNTVTLEKLFKKHRKELGGRLELNPTMHDSLLGCEFWQGSINRWHSTELQELLLEAEQLYILSFEKEGTSKQRRKRGLQALKVSEVQESSGSLFRCGIWLGSSVCLILMMSYNSQFPNNSEVESFAPFIRMYRLTLSVILMCWAWALNLYVYRKVRINYRLIFDFDPRNYLKPSQLLDICSLLTCFWLVAVSITQLGWIEAPYLDFDNDHTIVYPMATFAIFLVATLLAQILGDMWLLDVMWNIIRAPFVHVAFKDFYVADQLTTLAISLVDFEFSMCYLFAGGFDDSSATESHACVDQNNTLKPYIAMIPSWWRLMQCFRRYWDSCPATAEGVLGKDLKAGDKGQLWNALKYGCAFPVTITSVIRKAHDNSDVTTGFWIVAVAVGALYKLYWDIYKDWGLGDLSNRYLRTPKKDQDGNILPNRMNHLYPIPCYYMAIAANVVLRFGWAMTVSPQFINPVELVPCRESALAQL